MFCFSTRVHQYNIAFSVVHVQICFKSILFIFTFISCRQGVPPVGLYENNNCTPNSNDSPFTVSERKTSFYMKPRRRLSLHS